MAEVSLAPGGGPPPHVRYREEGSSTSSKEKPTIQAGAMTLSVSPGDFVHLHSGIVRSFRNTGNVDAKFLLVVAPA